MTLKIHPQPDFGFVGRIRRSPTARLGTAILASAYPAVQLGRKIHSQLSDSHLFIPLQFLQPGERVTNGVFGFEMPVPNMLQDLFQRYQTLVCVMPAGVVIRGLAPLLVNCENLPSVLIVDLSGKFVVSLFGDTDKNTNHFTREVAKITGGQEVVTDFGDQVHSLSLDWISGDKGWKLHPKSHPGDVLAALINHQPVALVKDGDLNLPASWMNFPWTQAFPDWQTAAASGYRKLVVLTCRSIDDMFWQSVDHALVCFLPLLAVGVNFPPGTSGDDISQAVLTVLLRFNLSPESLVCLATAEDLRDEPGLNEAARLHHCSLRTFSRERINQMKNHTDSFPAVRPSRNGGGVAETAAHLASGAETLLVKNQRFKRVTVAIAMIKPLLMQT